MKLVRFLLPLALAAQCMAAHAASEQTQEWVYQTYSVATGRPLTPGLLRLTQDGDQYKMQLIMSDANQCYRSAAKALVTAEGGQQFIEMVPLMSGCEAVRFVVKTDGSGGTRELKQSDGSWKWDGTNRILTRKQ